MNLKNFLTLTVRVQDYNLVAGKPELLKKLRKLTLSPYSGMNYELNNFERIAKVRKVDCKIITVYKESKLVGWAMLSKEPSDFLFRYVDGHDPSNGVLFQVFIHKDYRKQGIATELLRIARRKANRRRLCVCPHDYISEKFYDKFKSYNAKYL
jgi:ribosomal protein S18 acetylase RimI-like enzyme